MQEIIGPDEIKSVKDSIRSSILWYFPNLDQNQVDNILDDESIFTQGKITHYHEKLKSWEWITIWELRDDFASLDFNQVFENLGQRYFDDLKSLIEGNFDTSLDEDQQASLRLLIQKHFLSDDLTSSKLDEILGDKNLKIKEIYPLLWSSLGFGLDLVWSWIISVFDMAWDFVWSSNDIINIAIPWIWLSWNIDTESLIEKLDSMDEDKRAALIWLLYRKWWIFFSAIGELSAAITRVWLDVVLPSNTWVDWLKLFKDGILEGPEKQFRNIARLEQAITWVADNIYITKVEAVIGKLKDNYKMMHIIESSRDIDWFKRQMSWKNASFIGNYMWNDFNINNYRDLDDISKLASQRVWSGFTEDFEIKLQANKNHLIKEKAFGFWKSSAMQELNRAIENAVKHQQNVLDRWFWVFSKFRETLSVSKVAHLSDKLVFEFQDKVWAKSFLKQMNVLAQSSPELIKWFFNKLPIISIVWFSAHSEKPFLEELLNQVPYLIPIVWPIALVWNSWIDWNDGVKVDNLEQLVLWGWFLAFDWYFLIKEKWIQAKIRYLGKPIMDIYDIWRGTAEIWHKLYKTARVMPSPRESLKEAISKTNKFSWKKRIAALVVILWFSGVSYAMGSEDLSYEEYMVDWELDMEKVRQDASSMPVEDKIEIIKLYFPEEISESIEFSLAQSGGVLNLKSSNENIKADWFIDSETYSSLSNVFWIDEVNFSYVEG